jgi:hypothetical protein
MSNTLILDTQKHITEWKKVVQVCAMVMAALQKDPCEMSSKYLQVLEALHPLIEQKIGKLEEGVPFQPINENLVTQLSGMSVTAVKAIQEGNDPFSAAMVYVTSSILIMFEGGDLPL